MPYFFTLEYMIWVTAWPSNVHIVTTLTHILNQKTNQSFKLNFRFHRFKFLISDYKVEIQKFSKSGIVRLSSKEIPLTYEFALEEDSIFDSNESEVINNA